MSRSQAFLNAGFALLVLMLAAWGAVQVAQRHWNWRATYTLECAFSNISGLAVGDKVRMQGMDAGVVESILPPEEIGGPITVVLRIDSKLRPFIRSDAVANIVANPVGPRVIEISPGKQDAPALEEGHLLKSLDPVEIGDIIMAGQETMQRLEGITREAEQGIKQINVITGAISRGEGTLGRLVRDDAAYHEMMALARRVDKAVGALDDNLSAMKGIFPLAGFFRDRGYDEMERVLYRPNAQRESRTLDSDALFLPEKAILTPGGSALLDDYARWFKARRWPDTTEMVIAAFSDQPPDDDAARILTQDRALAVKTYFEQKHKLFEIPILRQRKVAAVGYGRQQPKPDPSAAGAAHSSDEPPPPRRVEIVLFTPK